MQFARRGGTSEFVFCLKGQELINFVIGGGLVAETDEKMFAFKYEGSYPYR